jgi:enamine deaminase RidA (YjgF/YER057c/UK114 family)
MTYSAIHWDDIFVSAKISTFKVTDGATEYHAMLEICSTHMNAEAQYKNMELAIDRLSKEFDKTNLVWKRYFVSDAINQASLIPNDKNVAISVVQQPMLNDTKVAVWVYFVENCEVSEQEEGMLEMKRSNYKHTYTTQLHSRKKDELKETDDIFIQYTKELAKRGCTLKDNCIRTWIFVHGVDVHYGGMVEARKKYFEKENLTDRTHYIASTGIEGKYVYPESIVLMDAYAIDGIKQEQITYLKGLSHLNPTIEYGVTFERATAVDYGDRKHIFVSGTASIDNEGQIVHPLNINKQIERTLENIEVLLREGNSNMKDIAQMIVYLRDTADYDFVNEYMQEHYPEIPKVLVWAPVCRPGWLIEIECIAIKDIENSQYDKF